MSKPVKWTLLVLLLALLAGVGVRFGVTRQRERAYQNALHEAQALYASGDYAAAKTAYEALGLSGEAADCAAQLELLEKKERLLRAEKLLEAGRLP